jgi:hypothetical protein
LEVEPKEQNKEHTSFGAGSYVDEGVESRCSDCVFAWRPDNVGKYQQSTSYSP